MTNDATNNDTVRFVSILLLLLMLLLIGLLLPQLLLNFLFDTIITMAGDKRSKIIMY